MTGFNGKCMGMVESCASYCKGPTSGDQVCFRGLNIATWDTSDYEELVLEVTDSEGILQPNHKLYTSLVGYVLLVRMGHHSNVILLCCSVMTDAPFTRSIAAAPYTFQQDQYNEFFDVF